MQVPRHWREIPERYRLEAATCTNCQRIYLPRRIICPHCQGKEFTSTRLSGRGKLLTFTIIRVAAEGFYDEVPYAVAVVEMDEGIRLMGQVVDCQPDELQPGDRLITQFRRMREEGKTGMIMYAYKFVPDVGV